MHDWTLFNKEFKVLYVLHIGRLILIDKKYTMIEHG